jgi:glyoxalase family protein
MTMRAYDYCALLTDELIATHGTEMSDTHVRRSAAEHHISRAARCQCFREFSHARASRAAVAYHHGGEVTSMQLRGFHHLTAITGDIANNRKFFTDTLGMRLVKKTVNQDDVSAYHLFYADGRGSPGTDMTFFDWPMPREQRGTHSIARTGFRVPPASLTYWRDRLRELGVTHQDVVERDGRQVIDLEDAEGQRLSLVADDRAGGTENAWAKSAVPAEHQIRGLGPITISVPRRDPTEAILTELMGMRRTREYKWAASDGSVGSSDSRVFVYESADGTLGPAAELHVAVEPHLRPAGQGAGGVHHVAFRVPTYEEYDQWAERLKEARVPSSGPVDRFYFRSLYFREPNGILFELATDGPGFASDEPMESMGESLALPPFLEPRRKEIEAGLKPI